MRRFVDISLIVLQLMLQTLIGCQLSLSRCGLGYRKLALHCSAAYLAPIIKAGCADPSAGNAEARKHMTNDQKCRELNVGLVCVPLAVETYGCWGEKGSAQSLTWQPGRSKSKTITNIYQRLNLTLVWSNARALLSRSRLKHAEDMG